MSKDYYLTGATPAYASVHDQRFSYFLYVPPRRPGDPERYPLVVIQHGTGRTAERYRDCFADLAEKDRVIVLAPLFPAGIGDPDDLHNFKFIDYHGVRFDLLLLQIIEEVAARVPIQTSSFLLHGFSGGGQFAHRFLYLHPHRLRGVSIGAPGRLTFIDPSRDWWLGTADLAARFGATLDLEAIARVPVQLVVGALDVDEWEINNQGESTWLPGLEEQGRTRVERITNYHRNLAAHGVSARLDIVPGVAHDGEGVVHVVEEFFHEVLHAQTTDAY